MLVKLDQYFVLDEVILHESFEYVHSFLENTVLVD